MRKTLFALIACCMAATTAFAQHFEFTLSEDHPQGNHSFEINNFDGTGTLFVELSGNKPDEYGRWPVQIKLENSSYYSFLLFDSNMDKKELRKHHIKLGKNYTGTNSKQIEEIELGKDNGQGIAEVKTNEKYVFSEFKLVENRDYYQVTIPIHLAKPICKKWNKIIGYNDCTVSIKIDNRDEVYEKLRTECDTLETALSEALERKVDIICTHPNHPQTFDEQTKEYTNAIQAFRGQIEQRMKGLSPNGNKYKNYDDLLKSLKSMEEDLEKYKGEEHYCGKDTTPKKKTGSGSGTDSGCQYCNRSLEWICSELEGLCQELYRSSPTVTKQDAVKKAKALYNCCTTHETHSKQWKNSQYKEKIINYHNAIMNWVNEQH